MNLRLIAFVTVVGLSVSTVGVGAAAIILPPQPEQLVEGHTVFTVIQPASPDTGPEVTEYAAAVAVLVREFKSPVDYSRFPGVLWFNDQYLVNPSSSCSQGANCNPTFRYPCTGAVLAVNQGGPDPRTLTLSDASYIESYRIKDPNNKVWTIDVWTPDNGGTNVTVWAVTIGGATNDANRATADNGNSGCNGLVYTDGATKKDPGDENGRRYPADCGATACPGLQYNALLLMRLKDLTIPGTAKNHTEGSTDRTGDVSGCEDTPKYASSTPVWPCPAGDDNREGNSHPYNPDTATATYAGENNHGGSADCNAGLAGNDQNCHATFQVDIYYGTAPVPTTRSYPQVWRDAAMTKSVYEEDGSTANTDGSTAPYHGHSDN
ncbi:MAG TPA: hypothetical protein VHH36_00270 [Candidatus Thermoplasmatota archaeon]|nr:hypothetical protein [Candidatus Thermoplasmatota archaeon]